MIEQGIILMAIGMGTVMAFLTTMILVINASAGTIGKFFPEKKATKKSK